MASSDQKAREAAARNSMPQQKIISPPGVTVDNLICEAASLGEGGITPPMNYNSAVGTENRSFQHAAKRWYNNVKGKGPWDFKQQGKQYEGFGNFAFGATGTAVGIPEEVLLRGAGWAQGQAGIKRPEYGHWLGGWPHGDDPLDQISIKKGIEYAKAHPCKRR